MKLALSMGAKNITGERLEACRLAGIEAIEVSEGSIIGADAVDFASVKTVADECGVALWSFHLPFLPFETIDISHPSLLPTTL